MAYDKFGPLLNYFVPIIPEAGTSSKPLSAMDIGAASGTHGEFMCVKACRINKLQFALTLEAASGTTTAPTVVFAKRVTPGSDTGKVAVGTITVPTGTAIGKVVYKKIKPVTFAVGDVLLLTWTIGVGTPTGIGSADIEAEDDPETIGSLNNADYVLSP